VQIVVSRPEYLFACTADYFINVLMHACWFCSVVNYRGLSTIGWFRGSVVERRSLTGELSLSCARPVADW